MTKPLKGRKTITFLKLRWIDFTKFKSCFKWKYHTSTDTITDVSRSLKELVSCYNQELRILLDQHALAQTKSLTLHPNTPWYTNEVRKAKLEKLQAERRMRKTGLTVHKEIFKFKSIQSCRLLLSSKKGILLRKDRGGRKWSETTL